MMMNDDAWPADREESQALCKKLSRTIYMCVDIAQSLN